MPCRSWMAWALSIAACGSSPAEPADADAGADAGAPESDAGDALAIAEPASPVLPVLTPCPAGWSERPPWRASAPATCEPWPAERLVECGRAQAWIPGEAGCAIVGAPCAADEWPGDLPSAGVLYVRPGATAGDGTRDAPFGSIADASALATSGTVIALAAGEHVGFVELGDGVTLRGACARDTTLVTPEWGTTVLVTGEGAAVEDVRITGPGEGVRVSTGSVTITGVAFEDVVFVAIVATAGTRLAVHDGSIRSVRPHDTLGQGVGIAALGADATVERTVVDGARSIGVMVDQPTGALRLSDVAVRRTDLDEPGAFGVGIASGNGATAELARVVVEESHTIGISASATASLTAEDVLIRDTRPDALGSAGVGMMLYDGTAATLRRVVVERNHTASVNVFSNTDRTVVAVEDLVVRDTFPQVLGGNQGHGIGVLQAADFDARRVLIDASHTTGLALYDGATGRIEDLTIRDVRPNPGETLYGLGVSIEVAASLEVVRALVEQPHEIGVHLNEGATLVAQDLTIRRVQPRALDGTWGRGLNVQLSTANVTRARLEENREAALIAWGESATIDASDVVITRTLERACAREGCPDGANVTLGMSAVSLDGALVRMRRFEVTDSALCGLQIGSGGRMDLAEGLVARNPIGVNLQNPDLPLESLTDRVVYSDNGVQLDSTVLPVPSPR